jgi:hypothetical protein
MESASTGRPRSIDIEAQWVPSLAPGASCTIFITVKSKVFIVPEEKMEEREIDERDAPRSKTKIDGTGAPWISTIPGVDPEALLIISQTAGVTSIASPLIIAHPPINRR